MEVAADTKVITIHMKCDVCGKGYMVKDGGMLFDHGMMISPARYKHRCKKCTFDWKENLDEYDGKRTER